MMIKSFFYPLIHEEGECECDSAAESAVHHDELVDALELVQTIFVGEGGEDEDACMKEDILNGMVNVILKESLTDGSVDRAEDNGEYDERPVPFVVVMNRGDPKEHEDDGLRRAREHFHRVLHRRLRLGADVPLHVVLHRDAAKGDAGSRRMESSRAERIILERLTPRCQTSGTSRRSGRPCRPSRRRRGAPGRGRDE
jgi:hypothetical protein